MNQVYYTQGLAHDKIMPANYYREFGEHHDDRIPYGAEVLEDGRVRFTLYAPGAKQAAVCCNMDKYVLEKKEDGMWKTDARLGPGYHNLNIIIDGNEVLYPMMPVGFGFSRPVNFVDIPESGEDFYEIRNVPHGTVCWEYLESEITGKTEKLVVYLPPDYQRETNRRYPVLYLQHGHGENENCWVTQGKVNFIYDNLVAEKKAVSAIVVMCNGMVQMEGRDGRYIDSRRLEELIVSEVIPFVDGRYRTLKERNYRAMAGLSMGSMQTSVITFKNQELFAWAGLFSGFLRDVMNEDCGHLESAYTDSFRENMCLLFRAMGTEDEFYPVFLEDDVICCEKDIPCLRKTYSGGHEWQVWRKCIRDFAQLIFR